MVTHSEFRAPAIESVEGKGTACSYVLLLINLVITTVIVSVYIGLGSTGIGSWIVLLLSIPGFLYLMIIFPLVALLGLLLGIIEITTRHSKLKYLWPVIHLFGFLVWLAWFLRTT